MKASDTMPPLASRVSVTLVGRVTPSSGSPSIRLLPHRDGSRAGPRPPVLHPRSPAPLPVRRLAVIGKPPGQPPVLTAGHAPGRGHRPDLVTTFGHAARAGRRIAANQEYPLSARIRQNLRDR